VRSAWLTFKLCSVVESLCVTFVTTKRCYIKLLLTPMILPFAACSSMYAVFDTGRVESLRR
jgi:hypothetical protein